MLTKSAPSDGSTPVSELPSGTVSERSAACGFLKRIPPGLWLALLTLCLLLPFANKAVHIDDPLFLWSARQIAAQGADFYGFNVNWYGMEMPMAKVTENPPLASYYMAVLGRVFGWKETALHLGFLLPALLLVLGTYRLAQKFVSRPALATLAALLTPAFLVSSTTLMCDVMMLGFWVWAVVFWIDGLKENRWSRLIISALLIGLAALAKYYAVALVPLLFAYTCIEKRRLSGWTLLFLIPCAILGGYEWLTSLLYGQGLISAAMAYAGEHSMEFRLLPKVMVAAAFTGACLVPMVFCLPFFWSRWKWTILLALGVIAAIPVFSQDPLDSFSVQLAGDRQGGLFAQFVLCCAGGLGLLAATAVHLWKRRDPGAVLLLLWIIGTFVFAAMINWSINARSILPMVPAMGILLVRFLEQDAKLWRKLIGPLAASGLVSLAAAWADYDYAGRTREQAQAFCREFSGKSTLWFQTHWGFQYYMQEGGAKPIDLYYARPGAGDVLISPKIAKEIRNFGEVSSLKTVASPGRVPLATCPVGDLRAGFYASIFGPLPFVFGAVPPQEYEVQVFQKEMNLPAWMHSQELNAATLLWRQGSPQAALLRFRQALLIKPDDLDLLAALSWTLATQPDPKLRNKEEALALAQKAARLSKLNDVQALDSLAAAYAENGCWAEAVRTATRAIELAERQGNNQQAENIRSHLAAYQAQNPWRGAK